MSEPDGTVRRPPWRLALRENLKARIAVVLLLPAIVYVISPPLAAALLMVALWVLTG